jgi:hypothetical protein
MQINRAFPFLVPTLAGMLALSGCGDVVPRADNRQPQRPPVSRVPATPPAPPPIRRAPPPPPPPPPAIQPAQRDWRDVPPPAGDWTWQVRPGGSIARYGQAGFMPVAMIVCNRAAATLTLAIPAGQAPTSAPPTRSATITTSTGTDTFVATPSIVDGLPTMAITLPATHRMLDAMAFSRGQFLIEISGFSALALPSWAEVGRVAEDCRG